MIKTELKDKTVVADILAKSFDENRSFNTTIKQDNDRVKKTREVFEYYLENYQEKNVILYKKAGFTIYNKLDLGFPVFCRKRALN
ncbi:hypothetical protein H7F33_02800 [Pedobacter sp. PAMC26386]|nr:hypothetical protein H7F33_02800 [Pedobacter sp. PAMC26386]